jgi:hypothetical protein
MMESSGWVKIYKTTNYREREWKRQEAGPFDLKNQQKPIDILSDWRSSSGDTGKYTVVIV